MFSVQQQAYDKCSNLQFVQAESGINYLRVAVAIPSVAFRQSEVQFSSVHDGIYALGKAHMRSTMYLRSFPNVAFEKFPMFV